MILRFDFENIYLRLFSYDVFNCVFSYVDHTY